MKTFAKQNNNYYAIAKPNARSASIQFSDQKSQPHKHTKTKLLTYHVLKLQKPAIRYAHLY